MSSVTLELDLPEDWAEFNMPPALDARLTTLLDQQDQSGELAEPERKEAEALCKLVDMLALLKLRAEPGFGPIEVVSPYIPVDMVRQVRSRAHEICEYCLLPQQSQEATFHIDHIVPRQAGGLTEASNLALACVTCSLRKAAKSQGRDPLTGLSAQLFDPRRQTWLEHFTLNDEFLFEGLTSTGRATIETLGMNRATIVSIRKELNFLGLFPPE